MIVCSLDTLQYYSLANTRSLRLSKFTYYEYRPYMGMEALRAAYLLKVRAFEVRLYCKHIPKSRVAFHTPHH